MKRWPTFWPSFWLSNYIWGYSPFGSLATLLCCSLCKRSPIFWTCHKRSDDLIPTQRRIFSHFRKSSWHGWWWSKLNKKDIFLAIFCLFAFKSNERTRYRNALQVLSLTSKILKLCGREKGRGRKKLAFDIQYIGFLDPQYGQIITWLFDLQMARVSKREAEEQK